MGDWLTVQETASLTDRSEEWVHQRVRDGTFRAHRDGRRVYVSAADVMRWIGEELAGRK